MGLAGFLGSKKKMFFNGNQIHDGDRKIFIGREIELVAGFSLFDFGEKFLKFGIGDHNPVIGK